MTGDFWSYQSTVLIIAAYAPEPCYVTQYERLGFKPCGSANPTIRNVSEPKALTMQDVRAIKVGGLLSTSGNYSRTSLAKLLWCT